MEEGRCCRIPWLPSDRTQTARLVPASSKTAFGVRLLAGGAQSGGGTDAAILDALRKQVRIHQRRTVQIPQGDCRAAERAREYAPIARPTDSTRRPCRGGALPLVPRRLYLPVKNPAPRRNLMTGQEAWQTNQHRKAPRFWATLSSMLQSIRFCRGRRAAFGFSIAIWGGHTMHRTASNC